MKNTIPTEDKLQAACVRWFRLQYPELKLLLFSCPNGGSRNPIEAAKLKRTGVVSGVSDLILLTQRKGYGSLCIELKNGKKGIQSENQHQWELAALSAGNKYVICRTFEEFMNEVNQYLK